jgi:cytochrome c-type biogenesis protein CcmH/NrfF
MRGEWRGVLILGLAVLWLVPLVVTAIFVVMIVREERAERRELEREVRALDGYDPRVHGRADHLRI